MSVLVSDLITLTLAALGEPSNSTVGEVEDGQGGVTWDTNTVIIRRFGEVGDEISRTCAYLEGIAAGNATANRGAILLHDLAPASNTHGKLWAAQSISFGGAILRRIESGRLRAQRPNYALEAASVPKNYFAENGQLVLYPAPMDVQEVKASGPALPPVIGGSGSSISWLPDDLIRILYPVGAAIRIVKSRMSDPLLTPSLAVRAPEYDDLRQRMYAGLSPDLRDAFYKLPPVPVIVPQKAAK